MSPGVSQGDHPTNLSTFNPAPCPMWWVFHRTIWTTARCSAGPGQSLLPHRPYDCAINLQPGTSPPRGRLFSLSAPEKETMETYVNNSLAAGIIRPSSSPTGAGFFFVEIKDKTEALH